MTRTLYGNTLARRYLPRAKDVLHLAAQQGRLPDYFVLRESTQMQDEREGVDLLVDGPNVRLTLGLRTRNIRTGDDATIRSSSSGPWPSELQRILRGRGPGYYLTLIVDPPLGLDAPMASVRRAVFWNVRIAVAAGAIHPHLLEQQTRGLDRPYRFVCVRLIDLHSADAVIFEYGDGSR